MTEPASVGGAEGARAPVAPRLPLTLLETVRRKDLPPEILEGEDLPASLPRRLGLSDVVARQIQRHREAQRRGERVPADEVMDLVRLVLRRPDAQELLQETGRELAREHFRRVSLPLRGALRLLPRRALLLAARRAARRMLRPVAGARQVAPSSGTTLARMEGPLTADDDSGTACLLFSGALEELASLYTRSPARVVHSRCEALGADVCEWALEEPA